MRVRGYVVEFIVGDIGAIIGRVGFLVGLVALRVFPFKCWPYYLFRMLDFLCLYVLALRKTVMYR